MIKTILVVCIGNICRSPMAQALLRQSLPGVSVISAGIGALSGYPADPSAVEVMAHHGIDISEHRAQQLTGSLVSRADLILVMDGAQKQEIQSRHPAKTGSVFRLGEMEQFDIADPYRKQVTAFEEALEMIQRGVDAWVPRIRALG
ncbi:low molecular weight protein-tyrosine-phosphatase [Ralstonia pseudosolanacearum]|uniref:protein-tyrosine-phosphatase n=1 Tax=Ralstonia solanacearum TaxID=305 RepID=A0AA92K7N8_RALSL|nr:low molecular weight protein-tyrosine-phosphatase [Ralstonia pseudosolanacearum]QOK94777.1 low molecular weight phosphotyrosine protein phosphatase [Ralstonia pseudosolanacearum]QOK99678.1 low molecular weight phosphotyrosine protein phosphatase [Ralstonia pseudosolanacearum]UWD88701.1 low molecular weight phosphotyrosine protein phosphatase [Ralstonia pseudosolanacearum]CAH0440038.1 Low molecular weight protein-tyrosine-phosphatase Ptp [Ralstonia pseudosolanacearum]